MDADIDVADERLHQEGREHAADIALDVMYYNFARTHQTLRVTPVMEGGLAHHVWSVEEIVALVK